jgi:hypothetical protein
MNWDATGAIGEVAGAIGVIVTLIYLANQLRQNTKAMRSSTYEAYNQSGNSLLDFGAQFAADLAAIQQHTDLQELTPEQSIVYSSWAMKIFNSMEATYLHHRAGSLDDEVFEARVFGYGNLIRNDALLYQAWTEYQQFAYTKAFKEFMDSDIIGQRQ